MTRYIRELFAQDGDRLWLGSQDEPFLELNINNRWHDPTRGILYVRKVVVIQSADTEGPILHEVITVGAPVTLPTSFPSPRSNWSGKSIELRLH